MLVPLSPSAADNKLPNYNLQTLRFQRRGRGEKINEINLMWAHFLVCFVTAIAQDTSIDLLIFPLLSFLANK